VLLSAVDDRVIGPDNLSALVRLFTVERLGDVPIAGRAALLAALQRGRTGALAEAAVRDIILGTCGTDLTRLKQALDTGGAYRDLHQLIYRDLDDADIREQILRHIADQATPCGEIKILSDIDDTFYANWKDQRYPSKTVYPGVRQFFAELDRGPRPEPGRLGDLTFVTARPGDRMGLVEGATHATLGTHGLPPATILTGSFTRLIGNRAIAEKKFENFLEYRRIYPEYEFIFIGDSGQGDIFFGQRMLEAAPQDVKAVFIHDVVATPEAKRSELRKGQVFLFDTYVGAAAEALERAHIEPLGAIRVAREAMTELEAITLSSPQRASRRTEIARDVERMNQILPAADRVTASFPDSSRAGRIA
jgi:hypothetical protein